MYTLYCAYSGSKYFFLVQLISASQAFCASSLKFIRLLRVVFSSQQRLNRPAVNAVQ